MLSLDAVERDLVLSQLEMPNFVDFPWEVFPFLMSGWGLVGGKVGREVGGREGGGPVVGM